MRRSFPKTPARPIAKTIETVRFHGLSAGGDAVGRDENGRTIFAPLAAPDETAQVEITHSQNRFARGRIIELKQNSPHRIEPPCPYFQIEDDETQASQPECGGCQWQHIEYSMQLAAKRELVVQALKRIGEIENADQLVELCAPSPQPFFYRNKADFVVSRGRLPSDFSNETEIKTKSTNSQRVIPNYAGSPLPIADAQTPNAKMPNAQTPDARFQIGFFARESHRVVDVARCLIQQEPNNLVLQAVRKACENGLATPFDARQNCGELQSAVVRTSSKNETSQNEAFQDEALLVLTATREWPQLEQFARFVQSRAPHLVGVLLRISGGETRVVIGRDWLEEIVDGLKLRVASDRFFQVNSAATSLLLRTALGFADVQNGNRVLDLYCGVGLFALGLARQGAQVLGIEQNEQAIESAIFNARQNGLQAEFLAGDVAQVLRNRAKKSERAGVERERVDVVLLDPPRAGAKESLSEIARLEPRRIVYVSCDAATLARDLRTLQTFGYSLKKALPIDLFPQTSHVETVALLERNVS